MDCGLSEFIKFGEEFQWVILKIHFYVESLNEIYVSSLKIKAPLTGRTFLNLNNYVGSHACMATAVAITLHNCDSSSLNRKVSNKEFNWRHILIVWINGRIYKNWILIFSVLRKIRVTLSPFSQLKSSRISLRLCYV